MSQVAGPHKHVEPSCFDRIVWSNLLNLRVFVDFSITERYKLYAIIIIMIVIMVLSMDIPKSG